VDAHRIVAGIGRTMIATGMLILLFVAYQLWGTGLAEARSQDRLREQFDQFVEAPTTTPRRSTTTVKGAPATTARPTTEPIALPPTAEAVSGEPVALIHIPKIGLDKVVIEDVTVGALKKGPGHYPTTPLPGQPGNAAIAGHRTTYGAPFAELDKLEPGDAIEVTTREGEFVYRVTEALIVKPSQSEVLDPTDDNRLTLTTCHPRFSARERLIVVAALTDEPVAPDPVPEETTTTRPRERLDNDAAGPVLDDPGLSGDPAARGPAIAWGAVAAAVWLLSWLASRRIGRIAAYAVGLPLFLVALFVFFENFARLLPANI
jgi:sortase A